MKVWIANREVKRTQSVYNTIKKKFLSRAISELQDDSRTAPTLCPFYVLLPLCGPCSINSHLLCGFCYWQVVLQTEAGLVKEPEKKETNTWFGTLRNAGI